MTCKVGAGLRGAAVTLWLGAACIGKSPPPPSGNGIDARDFYPLQTGNAWSYDVDTGDPSTTLAITRVEAFDGRIAEVRTGDVIVHYEVRVEGVRVPSEEAWLIRAPLEPGAMWPARGGRTARLVSIHAVVSSRAGSFERCVEVLETGGKLDLEVRTIYCPGVGPVSVESTMRSELTNRAVTVSASLRGYQVNRPPARDR
jgi:hypothetical protein